MIADLIAKVAGMGRKDWAYRIRPSLASPEVEELGQKGRCKRQLVYWRLDYPKDNIQDRFQLAMDDSLWHEDLSADWINKTAFRLRDRQFRVNCGYFGMGSIDGILTDLLGIDYLWEHKAVNHFGFQRYEKGELPIDYVVQCCIYILGLQEYLPTLNQVLLLIKNKNTAQYLEFLIQYDKTKDVAIMVHKLNSIDQKKVDLNIELPNLLTRAREKFDFVEQKAKENTLPKRDYEMSDWQCDYCGWKGICWKDYQEEFEKLGDKAELSQDIEERIGYYLELQMHIKEQEKEAEAIKEEVKKAMQILGARGATTENYAITISLIKSKRVDQKLIPLQILNEATTESFYEKLTIHKKKT